jgi:hypothetical protein
MPVLQKFRIRGDEFDLVFVFQIVYDSFEQPFLGAADFTAAVSGLFSGSFQRSHFFPIYATETQRHGERKIEGKSDGEVNGKSGALSFRLCVSVSLWRFIPEIPWRG